MAKYPRTGERRDLQILSAVEPTVYSLAAKAADQAEESLSGYVRRLIMTDLIERGLLTPEIQTKMLLGQGIVNLADHIAELP